MSWQKGKPWIKSCAERERSKKSEKEAVKWI